ncbi:MAG TPA: SRPBCC domain-containing protein [Puia sp.]|nr:SRPBCC domain-containing protein [Puia sp.]
MSENSNGNRPYDWSRFLKRVNIDATAHEIYHAISTRQGMEEWFLRKAIFTDKEGKLRKKNQSVHEGDRYEWYWYGWDDATVERGTILEANGKNRFKFSFGRAGTVTISIKTEGNEMVTELLQENIPVDEQSKIYFHLGCTKGWVFYLANLKSILEGGIDLRNKNVMLKDMINA